MCPERYDARQTLPTIAEIIATTRNVTAVRNRSPPPDNPPVNTQTRSAASNAIGNANMKPKMTMMIMPIMNMTISIQSSDQKSVGIAICNAVKMLKSFASTKDWAILCINGLLRAVVCTTVDRNHTGFNF